MSATGTWNATIISPMGKNPVEFVLVESDGTLTGTATAEGETVAIREGQANGDDLSWTLAITKPMRMSFAMKVHRDGDTWKGTAKAKIFPAAKVVGERVSRGGTQGHSVQP
jgi:hypothetical protein